MKAMLLHRTGELREGELPDPLPAPGEVRIAVSACGVCRTDLHLVDGELPDPLLPVVPGHEIVGVVDALGAGVDDLRIGQRVGVGWLGHTCRHCRYCRDERENLCDAPLFTGYTRHGGFATHAIAEARYAYLLPSEGDDAALAPLLCAGLIGWRSLVMADAGAGTASPTSGNNRVGDARSAAAGHAGAHPGLLEGGMAGHTLGIYGFGAAGHLIAQVARWQGRRVFVFTRSGDTAAQDFARVLGAAWVGASEDAPPEPLDAAIIYAPVGALVPAALRAVRKGGRVVCAGIHMSDIPSFPYRWLWEERQIVSVANLTRADAIEFLALAPRVGLHSQVSVYPLAAANAALDDLRSGRLTGAAVLRP